MNKPHACHGCAATAAVLGLLPAARSPGGCLMGGLTTGPLVVLCRGLSRGQAAEAWPARPGRPAAGPAAGRRWAASRRAPPAAGAARPSSSPPGARPSSAAGAPAGGAVVRPRAHRVSDLAPPDHARGPWPWRGRRERASASRGAAGRALGHTPSARHTARVRGANGRAQATATPERTPLSHGGAHRRAAPPGPDEHEGGVRGRRRPQTRAARWPSAAALAGRGAARAPPPPPPASWAPAGAGPAHAHDLAGRAPRGPGWPRGARPHARCPQGDASHLAAPSPGSLRGQTRHASATSRPAAVRGASRARVGRVRLAPVPRQGLGRGTRCRAAGGEQAGGTRRCSPRWPATPQAPMSQGRAPEVGVKRRQKLLRDAVKCHRAVSNRRRSQAFAGRAEDVVHRSPGVTSMPRAVISGAQGPPDP